MKIRLRMRDGDNGHQAVIGVGETDHKGKDEHCPRGRWKDKQLRQAKDSHCYNYIEWNEIRCQNNPGVGVVYLHGTLQIPQSKAPCAPPEQLCNEKMGQFVCKDIDGRETEEIEEEKSVKEGQETDKDLAGAQDGSSEVTASQQKHGCEPVRQDG